MDKIKSFLKSLGASDADLAGLEAGTTTQAELLEKVRTAQAVHILADPQHQQTILKNEALIKPILDEKAAKVKREVLEDVEGTLIKKFNLDKEALKDKKFPELVEAVVKSQNEALTKAGTKNEETLRAELIKLNEKYQELENSKTQSLEELKTGYETKIKDYHTDNIIWGQTTGVPLIEADLSLLKPGFLSKLKALYNISYDETTGAETITNKDGTPVYIGGDKTKTANLKEVVYHHLDSSGLVKKNNGTPPKNPDTNNDSNSKLSQQQVNRNEKGRQILQDKLDRQKE